MSGTGPSTPDSLLAWLRREAPEIGIERPPATLRGALIALFDRRGAAMAPQDATLVEHLGELAFDSRRDLALAGTRGPALVGRGYRLAFTSDAADVVLHIEPTGTDTLAVRGHVLPRLPTTSAAIVATVVDPPGIDVTANGDGAGRFAFTALARSARTLCLANETMRLIVHLPDDDPDPDDDDGDGNDDER